ncbi:hypothetical protein [Pedobacter sp. UBA4863]|uniref:hypothetical protein n=1 Tax=Pedobacter sp. UBA4863 TaxID=1947060 RepID=UPI0025EC4DB8|nr:hypothetical protein [Pedobacter sp. UBA4863]
MGTAAAICRLSARPRKTARCSGGEKEQAAQRTATANGSVFLKHRFDTVWLTPPDMSGRLEREFFGSLQNLCDLYQIPLPDVAHLSYPKNIATAYAAVAELLKGEKFSVIIGQDYRRRATIATTRELGTGHCLYYIPIRPLCRLMEREAGSNLVKLLLELFRYLYHIVGVPYHRNGYIGSVYEMMNEWVEDGWEDGEYTEQQRADLQECDAQGELLWDYLRTPFRSRRLRTAINACYQTGQADEVLLGIADDLLQLALQYPKRSLCSSICKDIGGLDREQLEEDGQIIQLDMYVSFYWSCYDSTYDSLYEYVNSYFMEIGYTDEPKSIQWFDKPQEKDAHGFDFEQRIFELLDRLTEQLNILDNEEHHQDI